MNWTWTFNLRIIQFTKSTDLLLALASAMGGRKILFIEFLILLFEIYDKIYGICLRKTTIKLVNSIKMIFPRVRRNANEEIKAIVLDDYDGDGTSRNLNTFKLELSTSIHKVSQCPASICYNMLNRFLIAARLYR